MNPPTSAQLRVLRVFGEAERLGRPPPTVREICNELEISSTNGVKDHLLAIGKKGLLRQVQERVARGWGLTPAGRKAIGMATKPMEAPWDDCKVAFGVKAGPPLFDLLEEPTNKARLPTGWELEECDGTGARFVMVFRVEGVPQARDGQTVLALLDELDTPDLDDDLLDAERSDA